MALTVLHRLTGRGQEVDGLHVWERLAADIQVLDHWLSVRDEIIQGGMDAAPYE